MEKQRGKYVSRAVYAKLQAERNRLLNDIKIMATGSQNDCLTIVTKWRLHFHRIKMMNEALRIIAQNELPRLKEKYKIKNHE